MESAAKLNKSIVKEITIALVCILLTLANTVYANTGESKKDTTSVKNKKEAVMKTKATKKLSLEEIEFYKEIEDYYQKEIVKSAEKPVSLLTFKKVVVYGQDGKVLMEQKEKVDLSVLPKGANKLFVDGDTAYYLVF